VQNEKLQKKETPGVITGRDRAAELQKKGKKNGHGTRRGTFPQGGKKYNTGAKRGKKCFEES